MVLYELNTNAMKYGALSNATGRVNVSWRLHNDELELIWREIGGPVVTPPVRDGFGTRLLVALSGDLGGEPTIEFPPKGVTFTLRSAIDKVQAR